MKVISIVDTCNIVNIFNIDGDEFLRKKIFSLINDNILDLKLIDVVYYELKDQGKAIRDKKTRESFQYFLTELIPFKYDLKDVIVDLGEDFPKKISNSIDYNKTKNGEFSSLLLSVYLSQTEPARICFYTDDYPAKSVFERFFKKNQVGYIEDSVDFLVLLFFLSQDINAKKLRRYLQDLMNEYAKDIPKCLNEIEEYEKLGNHSSDHEFLQKKEILKRMLTMYKLRGYNNLMDFFYRNKKYKDFKSILSNYEKIKKLESPNYDLLSKIQEYLEHFKDENKDKKYYKFI